MAKNVAPVADGDRLDTKALLQVLSSVKKGDFSARLPSGWTGIDGKIADTLNDIIEMMWDSAKGMERVSRVVGKEGKLSQRATLPAAGGAWMTRVTALNHLIEDLARPTVEMARVIGAVAKGDLNQTIALEAEGQPLRGEFLRTAKMVNAMVKQLDGFAAEVTRVAREVGTEGKLGGQAQVRDVSGVWKDLTESVNMMAGNLTGQVRNIADVTIAVANGDLSKKITADVRGEFLQLKDALPTLVDQLNAFAAEVTRVAREVGTEGKLGGQALVPGVAGTWKDLTDNVNSMASNLTDQVRNIADVTIAVANGDLSEKITVDVRGEILQLKEAINTMVDQLNAFAAEVTRVAREVGTDGNLGGQALVPGVAGTWKDLTDSVNTLAANLTTQVRAIAEVATAVTQGDLTRSIQVQARGEVAELKDNINAMIKTLRATTDQNTEEDRLKTNLAKFTRMMQGQRDLVTVGQMLLSELTQLINAQAGAIYHMDTAESGPCLKMFANYAYGGSSNTSAEWPLGAGLVGQCAIEPRRIHLSDIPPDYIRIKSGLGEASPRNLIVLPILFEGQTKAVIELASLTEFTKTHLAFLSQLTETIRVVVNTIEATMRTEGLLQQSQKLATEQQAQQKELQQTNDELASKAKQLAEQNAEVERKNQEIEQARHALEEKAAELALASKYKSEFLANMSHELRTPLNSVLILAQQLAENPDGNLLPKQVEFSKNIHASGADLLNLISDILDLSKIESGTVTVEPEEVLFPKVREAVERSFRHMAEARHLHFEVEMDPKLPLSMNTDLKRLQQVLKNLLSNAFKFTTQGGVIFGMKTAATGWSSDHPVLNGASRVIAFEVSDTGIGIPVEKQKIIFEAFHQADAGTSRRYGGTGLGLAISRELATLLGGEIRLASAPNHGSTFTLYLPENYFGTVSATTALKIGRLSPAPLIVQQAVKPEGVPDDRESVMPGDSVILIVEDDPQFARFLLDLARERGVKGVVTTQGAVARALAREFAPLAIILDIFLPDMLGWTVLSHLKQDPAPRHIPLQIISVEEERLQGLGHAACSSLLKPPSTSDLEKAFDRVLDYARSPRKRLLVVEDNEVERQGIVELLSHGNVDIVTAGSGAEAWENLRSEKFDCMVLDLRLPDISGFELLERIRQDSDLQELPIVVFTGKDLTSADEVQLARMAGSVVVEGVQSPEQLLDETSLFLHLVTGELSPDRKS